MDNLSFGITLTIVGMGGTFITMGLIILFTVLLKRAFPVETPKAKEGPK
jgi:hypothetical protein